MTAKPTARKRPATPLPLESKYPRKIPGESNAAYRKRPATPTPIITQRLSLLAEATARLAKAERLASKWHREADELSKMLLGDDGSAVLRTTLAVRARYLRHCATQLSRILKP